MAGRYLRPTFGRIFTASLAAWLLASLPGSAAFASSNLTNPCDNTDRTRLDVPSNQLHAANVSHEFDGDSAAAEKPDDEERQISAAPFVTLEADAALHRVFEESAEAAAEPSPDDGPVDDSVNQPAIKARVPGVSDGDLERYKRHMYRRDI